jgi:hypothetical protein
MTGPFFIVEDEDNAVLQNIRNHSLKESVTTPMTSIVNYRRVRKSDLASVGLFAFKPLLRLADL